MILVKKSNCLPCVLFSKPRRKRLSFNIMDRKECFLDQKSEVSKTSEKSGFSKGLVRVFYQKIKLVTMLVFLGRPRQKRSFSNILDRKEYFLEQRSEVLKTS